VIEKKMMQPSSIYFNSGITGVFYSGIIRAGVLAWWSSTEIQSNNSYRLSLINNTERLIGYGAEGKGEESLGLLLRAVVANPHVLLVHLEAWRTLKALGVVGEAESRYVSVAEESAFYVDPHICTACRYRADDMLWRCLAPRSPAIGG